MTETNEGSACASVCECNVHSVLPILVVYYPLINAVWLCRVTVYAMPVCGLGMEVRGLNRMRVVCIKRRCCILVRMLYSLGC